MRVLVCDAQVILGSRARPLFELQSSELEMALRDGELSWRAAHRSAAVRLEHGEPSSFELLVESRASARKPQADTEERQLLHGLSDAWADFIPAKPPAA